VQWIQITRAFLTTVRSISITDFDLIQESCWVLGKRRRKGGDWVVAG